MVLLLEDVNFKIWTISQVWKPFYIFCLTFGEVINFLVSQLKASLKNIRATSTFTKKIREWRGIGRDLEKPRLPLANHAKGKHVEYSLEDFGEFGVSVQGWQSPSFKQAYPNLLLLTGKARYFFIVGSYLNSITGLYQLKATATPLLHSKNPKYLYMYGAQSSLVEMYYFSVSFWDSRR